MTVLALLQCDVFTGDLRGNADRLAAVCASAAREGAELCAAPLESLAGPYARCFLRQADRAEASRAALTDLAARLADGPALICGTAEGQPVLLEKGQITPLQEFFRWRQWGISLGLEPHEGADLALSLSSRPFTSNLQSDWELILSGIARQLRCPCLSVNLACGCGQHIYNGQSAAMDGEGQLMARARAFAPDCLLLRLDGTTPNRVEPPCASPQEALWSALTLGLRDFVRHSGSSRVIIGLSGGMDSALVAAIARDAIGAEHILGVLMPSPYTSEASGTDALELAANLGIDTVTVPITPMFNCFREQLAPVFTRLVSQGRDLAEENLQARVRGVILMALANKSGGLVLNTGNKSESAMGYSTLYGDSVGAVAVIGDLFKTQVYELGYYLNAREGRAVIPENILDKEPSAELAPNQKDSDSLPPYDELDADLAKIFAASPEVALDPHLQTLRDRVRINAFKRRQSPPALIVSSLHPCDGCEEG